MSTDTYTIAVYLRFGGDVGMGHLKRMLSLAEALREYGHCVLFLSRRLSNVDDGIITKQGYGEVVVDTPDGLDEVSVQQITDSLCRYNNIKTLIIDDYSVDERFEQQVMEIGYRVVAIDDLCRNHRAEMVIDSKWRGKQVTALSYQGRVPATCRCLLGPKYYLFQSEYCNAISATVPLKSKGVGIANSEPFTIIVSLGGLPDLELLQRIVDEIREKLSPYPHLLIRPVVGVQEDGLDAFVEYCQAMSMEPIINAKSLRDFYRSSDLFVGAAGGSIYEAMLCGVPVVSFVVAENQHQESEIFAQIGHRYHFNKYYPECRDDVLSAIEDISSNYQKALHSLDKFRRYYDCKGRARVARAIDEFDHA